MTILENMRKESDPYLTPSQNVYNREHEQGTNPTRQGRPNTHGLAYLTPAKVRSPTGRDLDLSQSNTLPGTYSGVAAKLLKN